MHPRHVTGSGDGYVKRVRRKTMCPSGTMFTLTTKGRDTAVRLRSENQTGLNWGPLHTNVHPNGRGTKGGAAGGGGGGVMAGGYSGRVMMLMDFREGGGTRHRQKQMCAKLDQHKERIQYTVRSLPVADYLFQVSQ